MVLSNNTKSMYCSHYQIHFFFSICTIFIVVFLFSFQSEAKVWTYTQITNDQYSHFDERIDNGGLVWRGIGTNGKRSVFYMDLATGIDENIFNSYSNDYGVYSLIAGLTVSNGQVAWRGYDSANDTDTIFFWDGDVVHLVSQHQRGSFPYTGYPPSYGSVEPRIYNGQITYAAWDGTDYEIFLWDGVQIQQITDNDVDDYEPQISSTGISWTGWSYATSSLDIFFYDGQSIENISNMTGTNEDSHIQGGKITFTGYSGIFENRTDIYVWEDGVTSLIVPLLGYDYEPEFIGSLNIWWGWPNGKPDGPWVGWIWDGYKLSSYMDKESPFPYFSPTLPDVDPSSFIPFRTHVGEDWKVFVATYLTATYKQQVNQGKPFSILKENDTLYIGNDLGDLVILDVNDVKNPLEISTLHLNDGYTIVEVLKRGDFIFLAKGNGGVSIVDVAEREHPVLVKSLSTPGSATHIAIKDNYLFVGSGSGGFRVIDISSPESANEVGSIVLNGQTHGIAISGNNAFVANSLDGLNVIDISNPENPINIMEMQGVGDLYNIELRDNYAYLLSSGQGIKVIDIQDPYHPSLVGECSLLDGSEPDLPPTPQDISFAGQFAFVSNGDQGIIVVDISYPNNPYIVERIDTPGYALSIDIQGDYLFVADEQKGMHIIDVSDYTVTIYEDAEDLYIAGWDIYDDFPTGALINNVHDDSRQSRVIEFSGAGTTNGYRLRSKDNTSWNNMRQFSIEWSMKFDGNSNIYVDVDTTAGHRYLLYTPVDYDSFGTGGTVHHGLGSIAKNGQWQTFHRDLQSDLEDGQPGVNILRVNGFLIRGNGRIDDIKLLAQNSNNQDSDTDGIPDADEIAIYGTDPNLVDTDNDGINDGDELSYWGLNWSADYDDDGLINLLDPDSDNDIFFDGEEIAAGTDPSNPDSYPLMFTVYEDAENGNVAGWDIYDDDPPGALISNVFDDERQSQVIQFSGSGHSNGYRLRNEDGASWKNTNQLVAEWSMNCTDFFTIYINVETTDGQRFITYKPVDYNNLGTGTYVYYGLGSTATDGLWYTFTRDLEADLQAAQPGTNILAVNSFFIRGNGRIDDIKSRFSIKLK